VDNAKSLEKTESGNGGVEIQARRKSGSERETERLQRIHNLHGSSAGEFRGA
jgi:hypothetical protein